VFTGRDDRGRPTQTSRTVRGGKRDAQRVAVELEGGPGRASAAGRTVRDVLDEWVEHNSATWAPSSARDQRSRVKAIKTDDTLARMPVARLSVADVERWHARLRRAGKQDAGIKNLHGALRAALAQAQRWGWVSSNVAALARLRTSRTQKRDAMTADDVRAVIAAATAFDPAAGLALRLGAIAGARRAELAALRWDDVHGGELTIDSAIEVLKSGGSGTGSSTGAVSVSRPMASSGRRSPSISTSWQEPEVEVEAHRSSAARSSSPGTRTAATAPCGSVAWRTAEPAPPKRILSIHADGSGWRQRGAGSEHPISTLSNPVRAEPGPQQYGPSREPGNPASDGECSGLAVFVNSRD